MKRSLKTTAAALALAFAATAAGADNMQLAVSAGLDPSESARLSLAEIAQAKFNADSREDDRHSILSPSGARVDPAAHAQLIAAAGLTAEEAEGMTLVEIAAAKSTREMRGDERQVILSPRELSDILSDTYAQLIRGAGLTADEAHGMTLAQVARAKINREHPED